MRIEQNQDHFLAANKNCFSARDWAAAIAALGRSPNG
jgi:hypothetical protein